MADLSEKDASLSTKIVGQNSTGVETNPVRATTAGDLGAVDIVNVTGLQGTVTVGTTAVEARVGAGRLVERKSITVTNTSANIIYWGLTSGVTTANGHPIYRKQQVTWAIGDAVGVYLITTVAGQVVPISEGS